MSCRVSFTESELRELLRVAKQTDSDVRIEWRRFGMLTEAYLAHDMIRENLRESGIDVRFETGGAPHAVSRLIGEHMAIQRMGEGTGVVPKALLDDAHQLYERLAKRFEELTGEHVDLKKEFGELGNLYEEWIKWARQLLELHEGSAPRTDGAMRRHIDEKLERG